MRRTGRGEWHEGRGSEAAGEIVRETVVGTNG